MSEEVTYNPQAASLDPTHSNRSFKPRVLIACEYSGIERSAFQSVGCDTWSCDLLPSEIPGQHIQDDVLAHLEDGWDLIIAHPPCTYLSRAANNVWNEKGRAAKRAQSLALFLALYYSPAARVCVENPIGWPGAVFREPDQIIHPYFFGDRHLKRTALWLRGLPHLDFKLTDDLFGTRSATDKPNPMYVDNTPRQKKRYFTDGLHGSHARSRSFPHVAQAMAEQWGRLLVTTLNNQEVYHHE